MIEKNSKELGHKFLVKKLSENLEQYNYEEITQRYLAIVEDETKEESDRLVVTKWPDEEVTGDEKYKNKNLALYGITKNKDFQIEKSANKLCIPRYKLEEGIEILTDIIKRKIAECDRNIVVEIAGGSGSGKTTVVAERLKRIFNNQILILPMDDYYHGKDYIESEAKRGNVLNWDQPEALNLDLFLQHLYLLKSGKSVEKPIYDMKACKTIGTEKVNPNKIIIVEGLFALDERLKDLGDVKVFVDVSIHGRLIRKLMRDIQRTGRRPINILKYFSKVVNPMHEKYVESTKMNADLIIENEYNPEIESENLGLHEVQLKFNCNLIHDDLLKIGAEMLNSTVQIDRYYNPRDRNLIQTGEMLRIREEGNRRILTYKGPRIKYFFVKRPKFEFEIDEDTEKAFLNIYGNMVKIIRKERTLYKLYDVIFSVDKVWKNENGKDIYLGSFIEIKTSEEDLYQEKIKLVAQKLGLNINDGIKESYFEM
jgi:uridine kinase